MKNSTKKFAILAAGLLAGNAAAATKVVWDSEGTANEDRWDVPYAGAYTSGTGSKALADTTDENVIKLALTVSKGKDNVAGYGYGWKQECDEDWKCKDVAVSLSEYKGVCVTYKASEKLRMDFKQSNIANDTYSYNFYGADLPATTVVTRKYVELDKMTLGWGDEADYPSWAAGKQTGMQFGFKGSYVTGTTAVTNNVEIYSVVLGDECPSFPTELVGDAEGAETLKEGGTLKVKLSDIFSDEDGDAVVTVSAMEGKTLVKLSKSTGLGLNETVSITPAAANLSGTALIVFSADDGKHEAVTYTLTITLEDVDNPPTAADDSYTTAEDKALTVKAEKGILVNDKDLDKADETFTITLVDGPENGTLDLDEDGGFVYTPAKDFNGTDKFTYTITDGTDLTSEPATVTITVTPVNDPMVVTILDEDFFATVIKLEEDFDPDEVESIKITSEQVSVEDPDGISTVKAGVSSAKGIVKPTLTQVNGSYYISLAPVADANGDDEIILFFKDGTDSAGVAIKVSVAPVADPPVAVADKYTVVADSANKIDAKKGVLANDYNPDDKTVTLTAVLDEDATEGKVKLAEDGSFTYTAGDFVGEDSFTYHVENEEGDESKSVTVTLNVVGRNHAPVVVDSVAKVLAARAADLQEDFNKVTFIVAEMRALFKDDSTTSDKLVFSVRTTDSLTNPSVSKTNAVTIEAVKDACGEDTVIVSAKDGAGLTSDFVIPVKIACVNDHPLTYYTADTLNVGVSGWTKKINLDSIFYDVDGDTLKYVVSEVKDGPEVAIEDNYLILSVGDSAKIAQGLYRIKIRAYDAADSSALVTIVVNSDPTSMKSLVAAPKATWQNAIAADRGVVSLMDMQGRVMWTRRLPVSEAEVRAAAASVQGRKVLRVNRQVFTIK